MYKNNELYVTQLFVPNCSQYVLHSMWYYSFVDFFFDSLYKKMYIVLSPCFLLFSTHTSAFILKKKKNTQAVQQRIKRHFA